MAMTPDVDPALLIACPVPRCDAAPYIPCRSVVFGIIRPPHELRRAKAVLDLTQEEAG